MASFLFIVFYNEIEDEIQGVILDSFDGVNMSILPLLLQTDQARQRYLYNTWGP